MSFQAWARRARESIAYRVAPKSREAHQAEYAYYRQQPSCQVGHLWFLLSRYLGERDSGTFVEVGAFDGITYSNTWGLAERGWRGLLIEPVPQLVELCRSNHECHPNITVLECAVSDVEQRMQLHLAGPLSSANIGVWAVIQNLDWASGYLTNAELGVNCRTLDSVLATEDIHPEFDVLSVDVEGHETQVFGGFSLEYWRPKMIVVELSDDHPDLAVVSSNDARITSDILRAGYRIVFRDWINTVFVRDDVWEYAHVL